MTITIQFTRNHNDPLRELFEAQDVLRTLADTLTTVEDVCGINGDVDKIVANGREVVAKVTVR